MNRKRQKSIFCPLEEEKVDVMSVCGDCKLWDGMRCCFGHDRKVTFRTVRKRRSFFRRLRSPRRGGRGLRVPTVWEKWSMLDSLAEEMPPLEGESVFGLAGMLQSEDLETPGAEDEEYVLPELIQEAWEVQPDVPDWIPGTEPVQPHEPVEPPVILPEEPNIDLNPPGFGRMPDLGSPQDLMPGFPPNPFNEPMP